MAAIKSGAFASFIAGCCKKRYAILCREHHEKHKQRLSFLHAHTHNKKKYKTWKTRIENCFMCNAWPRTPKNTRTAPFYQPPNVSKSPTHRNGNVPCAITSCLGHLWWTILNLCAMEGRILFPISKLCAQTAMQPKRQRKISAMPNTWKKNEQRCRAILIPCALDAWWIHRLIIDFWLSERQAQKKKQQNKSCFR